MLQDMEIHSKEQLENVGWFIRFLGLGKCYGRVNSRTSPEELGVEVSFILISPRSCLNLRRNLSLLHCKHYSVFSLC